MWCAGPAALMAFCPGLWVSNPRSAHGLGADCEEKKLDLESLDLSKMRVAELKQILYSWEECRACVEKTDYVNLTKELAPKYAVTHPTTEL
ncbi:cerebral dopamine neurotrophic factor isoform X2 [Manis pentadactyla]|uniref:cerebral dopamine neurotrophic factor isoform X2 n=1 Tax=Manis pentadactyla TaxID=143292 RepID=UPI0018740114|nr:cerebral dopamine neurotrophic factor isoform X2 [Manis pentadactyla]